MSDSRTYLTGLREALCAAWIHRDRIQVIPILEVFACTVVIIMAYCKMKTTVMIAFISKVIFAGLLLAVIELRAIIGM